MEMQQIRTMLEEQIKASNQFTQDNFGLLTGDGYPEIVRELMKSSTVSGLLMLMLVAVGLSGRTIATEMAAHRGTSQKEKEEAFAKIILGNLQAFNIPFEFFYWGLQIGRKLEHEESETLRSIEKNSEG
jgi:hypothetical protein